MVFYGKKKLEKLSTKFKNLKKTESAFPMKFLFELPTICKYITFQRLPDQVDQL